MANRFVAGHERGKAKFVAEGAAHGHIYTATPGMGTFHIWSTPAVPKISMEHQEEAVHAATTFLPVLGGTSFFILHVPCDSVVKRPDYDPQAALDEFQEHAPEILATYEVDNPGMHRTDTIDYFVVLEGELHLELDDGEERCLRKHDTVVLNGTRHAWRNRSDRPGMIAAVLIGAERTA